MGARSWIVLAALLACGDDDVQEGIDACCPNDDAAVPAPDAPPVADGAPIADAVTDAGATDAAGLDAPPGAADLEATGITRGAGYRVQFCNRGTGGAAGSFRVRLTNVGTSDSFETAAIFGVPSPAACAETGDITCGLIGDPGCAMTGAVHAFVDSADDIFEADETNNQIVSGF